jgi:hypothetical protein
MISVLVSSGSEIVLGVFVEYTVAVPSEVGHIFIADPLGTLCTLPGADEVTPVCLIVVTGDDELLLNC